MSGDAWRRLLLWEYQRGSLAHDLLVVLMLLFLLLTPASFLGDPMAVVP